MLLFICRLHYNTVPRGPPSLLQNGYRVSFPRVKRPGRGVNHPPPSSAEVKVRAELYLYTPSEHSRKLKKELYLYFDTALSAPNLMQYQWYRKYMEVVVT
jgi:hypothetical protein